MHKDQEFLNEIQTDETPNGKRKESYKPAKIDSYDNVIQPKESSVPGQDSESDDVQIDNNKFFLRRVETMRMLGLLIPGGYEESNYLQEKLLRKKNRDVNNMLLDRLR